MPLAPFFDRARQSAAQVLADFDANAFEERLDSVLVSLVFDAAAAASKEARASLELSVRQVARLYPRIRIITLGDKSAASYDLAAELLELAKSINPDIAHDDCDEAALRIGLVFGDTSFEADRLIYVGSDRWIARISSTVPVGSGNSDNPFGAGAAACIALANVFRTVFADSLPRAALDDDVVLSLLNFETGSNALNGDIAEAPDIGSVQLVGVGAIGNAFVWGLSRLSGLRGRLDVIDHEAVDLSNLQRYVLACMTDVGTAKVKMAADALADTSLQVEQRAMKWDAYVTEKRHLGLDRVAVALDTARDRIDVQSSLPRTIHNAWTQTGDLGISRHGFSDGDACLACLYMPSSKRRNEDEIVAEELGFRDAQHLMRIRTMLYLGQPVGEEFVREVASNFGTDPCALMQFAELPLRGFRQKAICGNLIVRAPDGGGFELEVPLAFQSALAGIMMAADLVGAAIGAQPRLGTKTSIDLLRPLPKQLTFQMRSGAPGNASCICHDPDFVEVYRRKHGSAKRNAAGSSAIESRSPPF